MSYNELIKSFDKIRDYMREFYVYGFKSREQYNKKSLRSYDDERRRLESWIGEYMGYHKTTEGKTFFISVESRISRHNPLYKAWKAKSFTDGDITLFFIIFDILHSPDITMSNIEIVEKIDMEYLSFFDNPKVFDGSTIRKKLNEYVKNGLLVTGKIGKTLYYGKSPDYCFNNRDVLNYFSEVLPCGVIGSFLLDKYENGKDNFAFKHHYINSTLDSEIMCELFSAMHEKKEIEIEKFSRKNEKSTSIRVVPLRIFISVQSGRQYLMAYVRSKKRITSIRLDYILKIKSFAEAEDFDKLRDLLCGMRKYMWGVSTQGKGGRTETVEFTINFADDEEYIYNRLVREKRCGTVERIDKNNAVFRAEVYDTNEMLTWIRTFICRITHINFSNKDIEKTFIDDLNRMYEIYGVEL